MNKKWYIIETTKEGKTTFITLEDIEST